MELQSKVFKMNPLKVLAGGGGQENRRCPAGPIRWGRDYYNSRETKQGHHGASLFHHIQSII